MERRAFLRTVGVGLAGSLGAKSYAGESAPRPIAAPHTGPWTWQAVRGEFALDPNLVHMTGFFLASHPRVVREALEEHRRAFDDNPVHYLEENVVRYETALRRAAADYFAAEPDDFAVTDSTTMGLGIVYGGLKLTEGRARPGGGSAPFHEAALGHGGAFSHSLDPKRPLLGSLFLR